jgi:hypothetical protein
MYKPNNMAIDLTIMKYSIWNANFNYLTPFTNPPTWIGEAN